MYKMNVEFKASDFDGVLIEGPTSYGHPYNKLGSRPASEADKFAMAAAANKVVVKLEHDKTKKQNKQRNENTQGANQGKDKGEEQV